MEIDTENTEENCPVLYLSSKRTTIEIVGGIFCSTCKLTYKNKKDYETHYYLHNPELKNKTIPFTCVVCFKEFKGYVSLRNHCYNIHSNKDQFKCDQCPKSFHKSSVLKLHYNTVHKYIYPCSYKGIRHCKMKFSTLQELSDHMQVHSKDEPPYPCKSCNELIKNIDSCENHVDKHAMHSYTCPICKEEIPNKSSARHHLSIHFDEPFEEPIQDDGLVLFDDCSVDHLGGIWCYQCKTSFKNRMEFDSHFRSSHPEDVVMYMCTICMKQFDKYEVFGKHCYDHTRKHKFTCENCNKCFSRLSLLVCHRGVCSSASPDDPSRPFSCGHCGSKWADERRMRCHMREAHNVKNFMCFHPDCGQSFEKLKDLVVHQVTHKTTDKWCRQCGLEFSSLSACEKHLDIHTKKSYTCPVCTKTYNEKYLANKHISQHFETILHICKICGKVYNTKRRLVEHLKGHSDSKSLVCSYCGKGFIKLHKYTEHVNLHTGAKPYKCVVCHKSFSNHPNWSKHLRKMHNLDPKKVKIAESNDSNERNLNNNNSLEITSNNAEKTLSPYVDQSTNQSDFVINQSTNQENWLQSQGKDIMDASDTDEGIELDSIMPSVMDVLEKSLLHDEMGGGDGLFCTPMTATSVCDDIVSVTDITSPISTMPAQITTDVTREYITELHTSFQQTPLNEKTNYLPATVPQNDNETEIHNLTNVELDALDKLDFCLPKDDGGYDFSIQIDDYLPKWERPLVTRIYDAA